MKYVLHPLHHRICKNAASEWKEQRAKKKK